MDSPPQIPKWIERFLQWGLPSEMAEDILGDLYELFLEQAAERGPTRARFRYLLGAISLIPLFKMNPAHLLNHLTPSYMYWHYLKTAVRNLRKHAIFSGINILGLSLGLACCLLLIGYVRYEMGFDTFHEKGDRIFRVIYDIHDEDFQEQIVVTPNIISPMFQREFPEVLNGVRLYVPGSGTLITQETEKVLEKELIYADSTFFEIFDFGETGQNLSDVLKEPRSLVLTQSAANTYFPEEEAIGAILHLGSSKSPYKVKAVIPDVPVSSHLRFNMVASFTSLGNGATKKETFGSANYLTYLLLDRKEAGSTVNDKIPPLLKEKIGDNASVINFYLQPLDEVHLYSSHLMNEKTDVADIRYIYLFGGIAALILLIACINYINLTTARSADRAREVGLRKVVGARSKHLIAQFLGEAFLISMISMLIAILLVDLALPAFGQMLGKPLSFNIFLNMEMLLALLGTTLAVTILAGAYPAFVISSYKPISVLRGRFKNSTSGRWLRKSLVVFQFAVSVILIVSTMVMYQQMKFIQDVKLGYDKDQLLSLEIDWKIVPGLEALENAIRSHPNIQYTAAATESPYQIEGGYNLLMNWEAEDGHLVTAMAAGKDIVQTMGLEVIAGNTFTRVQKEEEPHQFLLNETCLERIGLSEEEALGRKIALNGRKGMIQGILRDFHTASLHQEIGPVVFFNNTEVQNLLVRIEGGNIKQTLDHIEKSWDEFVSHRPLAYHFVDEQYDALYKSESRIGNLILSFSFLAICIACLGLLGLISYTTVQRSKEIGIRKVLGATVGNVVTLLSKDFLRLIGISLLLGLPLGWYLMRNWLDTFSYKIEIGWTTFLVASLLAVFVALLTMSWQSLKAAMTNPVDSLRNE